MRFQNGFNKVAIELSGVQCWSEIILLISNRTRAARSFVFEITRMISDQIALHSVQLPLFIEALFRLRICLFRYVFCRRESSKTCYFSSFNTTVANNGLCEPYLLQTNSSFPLRLSESQGMFNLGQNCQNSEVKI